MSKERARYSSDLAFKFCSWMNILNFRLRFSRKRANHTKGVRIRITSFEANKKIMTNRFSRMQQPYIHIRNPNELRLNSDDESFLGFILVLSENESSGVVRKSPYLPLKCLNRHDRHRRGLVVCRLFRQEPRPDRARPLLLRP